MRLLAEDVIVAAFDVERGKPWPQAGWAAAAALFLEMALECRIRVSGPENDALVTVCDSTPVGDEWLDRLIGRMDRNGPEARVRKQVQAMRSIDVQVETLLDRGTLEKRRSKMLGVVPVTRVFPTSAAGRDELVARLSRVLKGEVTPSERDALLVAALRVSVPLTMVVAKSEVKAAERQTGRIVEGLPQDQRALLATVSVERVGSSGGYDIGSSL